MPKIINKEKSYVMINFATKYNLDDIVGKKYNMLTVLGFAYDMLITNDKGITRVTRYVNCKCDCGKVISVRIGPLVSNKIKSCGCIRAKSNLSHGMRKSRIYNIWCGMNKRCYNPNEPNYVNYGAKGIGVCEEWRKSKKRGNPGFVNFYKWSIENGYCEQPKNTKRNDILSIDRIDINKDYSPDNCRWIPFRGQSRNKRSTVRVTDYDGQELIMVDLAKKYNVSESLLSYRHRTGWSNDEIIYYLHHPELKVNTGPDRETYRLLTKDGFKVLIPTIDFMLRKNGIKKEV